MIIVMVAALTLLGGMVASSPGQVNAVPSFPPPLTGVTVVVGDNTTDGGQGVSYLTLTEEEKAIAMHIIESDAHVGEILRDVDWHVERIGPMTEGEEKVGAAMLIMFDAAVWMEDTFYEPSGYSYAAKLWVRSMFIKVDLEGGRIVGFSPTGMAKAPVTSKEHAAAAEIALSHPLVKALGEDVEVYLTAVYYTDDYPGGMVVFSMRSEQGEALVAVDLDKMVVIEQYTVTVIP
jgi:hypothetical protein